MHPSFSHKSTLPSIGVTGRWLNSDVRGNRKTNEKNENRRIPAKNAASQRQMPQLSVECGNRAWNAAIARGVRPLTVERGNGRWNAAIEREVQQLSVGWRPLALGADRFHGRTIRWSTSRPYKTYSSFTNANAARSSQTRLPVSKEQWQHVTASTGGTVADMTQPPRPSR